MLLIAAPRPYSGQLDRITVYSSRFMLRMIATLVVSELRSRCHPAGRRDGREPFSVTLWFPDKISQLGAKNRQIRKIA
jgi:hypothetical protein